jgi:hypothetical protein
MKRNYLLLCLLLSTSLLLAQTKYGIEHLSEDFSSGTLPSGWTIENYTSQWTVYNSANAGGIAPELRFMYTQGTLTTRFISPVVDVSSASSLNFQFKQFVDHYGAGYSIGVATRSNSGDWNNIWTSSPTGNIGPEIRDIPITNGDFGSSTFQVCFFLSGNAYQIDYWFIDDISLYTPYDMDLAVESITFDSYISQGTYDVVTTLKNVGVNSISSFDIQYQINDDDAIIENVSGITLNSGQTYTYTFNQQWQANPGNYNITILANNINGAGDDDDPSNNTLSKTVSVASQTVPNLPLFESFTSSTCPPCYTFNVNTFTPFLNDHLGEFAIIKYQMNWPGSGDPYYNAEGGVRRVYYGVNAVPMLFTGGESTATSATGLNNAFTYQQSKNSYFTINANSYVEGTTVHADIEVTPYITASGLKLRAAVVENVTTGNVGSNGETSFKWVMMKMLPDANGTTVNFVDGEPFNISFTQDMSSTFVEEYDDLTLVVFVQNDATKEVLQSKMVECSVSAANIIDFDFVETEPLSVEISSVQNNLATITVTVAFGTDITSLTPTITISEGATIYPLPGEDNEYEPMDFTEPIDFVITSSDGLIINTYTTSVIIEEPVYTVTFQITDILTENPIEGATITINSETFISDEDGMVSIELEDGEYSFSVEMDMYETFEGEFEVNGEDLLVEVEMLKVEFNVTFNVTDQDDEAIEGATITINEETLTTNEDGFASIILTNGEYDYTVSKDGFDAFNGTLLVNNDDVAVDVVLLLTGVEANELLAAIIYPNPTDGNFTITLPNRAGQVSVDIYTITGSLIFSSNYNLEHSELKLNIKQPQGVYLIKISLSNGDTVTKKLIVK